MNTDKIKFLIDDPVETDGFSNKAHERAATALTSIISSNQEIGRVIGLEGDWGSGKTSVIKMTEEQLKDTKSEVFTFDLWGHKEDHFKRSFLEELIYWMFNEKNIIEESTKKKLINEVNSRKKTIITENNSIYSKAAIAAFFLSPLIPLIYIWFNHTPNDEAKFKFFHWSLDVAANIQPYLPILLFIPFIIFCIRCNKHGWDQKGASKAISFVERKSEEDHKVETIDESDPSSTQFNIFFREEILPIIGSQKINLIIVLDNIDRISDPQEVRSIWADMRSFFAFGKKTRDQKLKFPWVVIPYDKLRLAKLLLPELDAEIKSHQELPTLNRFDHIKEIQKTFQSTIKVPIPIANDWIKFYQTQLQEAFGGELEEKERFNLTRLMDHHLLDNEHPASPRYLKAHINDLVTLRFQYPDEISIESLSAYTFSKDKIENDIKSLENGSILNIKSQKIFDDTTDWQQEFAALHYGVELEKAYEVLLAPKIQKAIENQDIETLNALNQNDGFISTLEKIVNDTDNIQEWTSSSILFSNVCSSIEEIRNVDKHYLQPTWKVIAQGVEKLKNFDTYEESSTKGFVSLINALSGTDLKNTCITLKEKLPNFTPEKENDSYSDGEEFGAFIENLEASLIERKSTSDLQVTFNDIRVPNNYEMMVGLADKTDQSESITLNKFQIKAGSTEITAQILSRLSTGKIQRLENVIRSFLACDNLLGVTELSKRIADYLKTKEIESSNAITLLSCLNILQNQKKKESDPALQTIQDDGSLLYWFHKGNEDNLINLQALSFYLLVSKYELNNPTAPGNHPHFGNTASYRNSYVSFRDGTEFEDNVLIELSKLYEESQNVTKVFSLAVDQEEGQLFARLLGIAIDRKKYRTLSVDYIFKNYDEISRIISEEQEVNFLEYFYDWKENFEDYLDTDDELKNLSSKLLSKCSPENGLQTISEIVLSKLQKLEEENWLEALESENDYLRLLITLLSSDEAHNEFGSQFQRALCTHAERVFEGKTEPATYSNDWLLLPKALPEQSQKTLFKDILIALNNWSYTSEGFLLFCKLYPDFFKLAPFIKHPENTLENIIKRLITSQSEDAFAILNAPDNYAIQFSECIKMNKPVKTTKNELSELISNEIKGNSEHQSSLENIAKLYGLKLNLNFEQDNEQAG